MDARQTRIKAYAHKRQLCGAHVFNLSESFQGASPYADSVEYCHGERALLIRSDIDLLLGLYACSLIHREPTCVFRNHSFPPIDLRNRLKASTASLPLVMAPVPYLLIAL